MKYIKKSFSKQDNSDMMNPMFEQIVLGTIQGIAEWLPVSSTSLLILTMQNMFHHQDGFQALTQHTMFLHLGTFLAAVIYFRNDVGHLVIAIFKYRAQPKETQNLTVFLIIATIISGTIGLVLRQLITSWTGQFAATAKPISLIIGIFLLLTAWGQLKIKDLKGHKTLKDLSVKDGIILGIAQGCAAVPGLSRSGLTVATLLFRNFDRAYALKISFLMSLPIVLGGNVLLNLRAAAWTPLALVGVFTSFVVGLASIHILLRLAQKINFGYFVLVFGVLTILSVFI